MELKRGIMSDIFPFQRPSNCTNMELKLSTAVQQAKRAETSNCTNMELKPAKTGELHYFYGPF